MVYHIARSNFLGKGNKAAASEASMNYARKWHEAGSKRVESRVENGTNKAQKWYKPGSKMERTRLENGTNQARTRREPDSKIVQTRLENGTNQARKKHEPGSKPARKILQFVSFRLEAGARKMARTKAWSKNRCFTNDRQLCAQGQNYAIYNCILVAKEMCFLL